MTWNYWSGHSLQHPDGYQLIVIDYLPQRWNCGGWRLLFTLPLTRGRILSIFIPQFTNWQGVPPSERPNYPWTQK